jgi:lipopolysaccharide/colanic/teichoic acid biosynthesis glycosyltransferase
MSADFHSHDSDGATVSGRVYTLPESAPSVAATLPAHPAVQGPERLFRYRVLKRIMDIGLVLLASPLILLLTLLIAIAIRIGSPGPIFFTHRRIRRHGAFFTMCKFRTMCVNSAEVLERHLAAHPDARVEWQRFHKLRDDPRVTPVGQFLRRTSLDELPQLWNVFCGSMSLVGPRPIVAAEVEKYGDFFADYCLVKPGLTGLWQISGRSGVGYEERVQFDRQYARTWSLGGDLIILVKTLRAVLHQDGAY